MRFGKFVAADRVSFRTQQGDIDDQCLADTYRCERRDD